jgi:purine nucleosidase
MNVMILKTEMMLIATLAWLFFSVSFTRGSESTKIRVLFDTDANNELDDQHALAYLLFNGDVFDVVGVTVNTTRNGGDIHEQHLEAERVMRLCNQFGKIPLLKGANGSFEDIRPHLNKATFDGSDAVNFIVEQARAAGKEKLVLLPVGKLTNIALALEKDPSIADKVRVVWLGSNYPRPGEYNQDNDIPSMNYILSLNVPFEMVTVRYGNPTGTDAVRATPEEINRRMPGKGPRISEPVTGRHGGEFFNFGDYSVNLFEHIKLHGNPPSRALFDMAAVAIVKNRAWAQVKEIAAPVYVDKKWVEQPDNPRKIKVWENFNRVAIMEDFYSSMENYVLIKP